MKKRKAKINANNARTIAKTGIIAAALSLLLCFLTPLRVMALSVSGESAVLIECNGGDIIYEKSAHKRMGMASTTKIMTAICAIESLPLDTVITVPQEAVGVEGSSVYLTAGEKITLEELLYALMLQSANDAAAAIAIAVSGSLGNFAELMNEKAQSLGLCDTHFENPHGLDGKTHYTTAYELARIAAYALENETFAKIVSTVKYTIPQHGEIAPRTLVNHNRLLRSYSDIIGVKTGFTRRCGRTLVSAAKRDGVTLVAVTLNASDDWNDHRAMLDHGFSLYEKVTVCEAGEEEYTLPVSGSYLESVRVSNKEAFSAVLRKDGGEITKKTELPHFVYAGQNRENPIGRVRFFRDGAEIGSLPLYLDGDVPRKEAKKGFFSK